MKGYLVPFLILVAAAGAAFGVFSLAQNNGEASPGGTVTTQLPGGSGGPDTTATAEQRDYYLEQAEYLKSCAVMDLEMAEAALESAERAREMEDDLNTKST